MYPSVPDIKSYYGKSLFSCPYCDSWELREQPLIIIAENEEATVHMGKLVHNWSIDLLVATNGQKLSPSIKEELDGKGAQSLRSLLKRFMEKVEFDSGVVMKSTGGFIVPSFYRANQFAEQLGWELQENGVIITDELGRTSQKNIYTAGEATKGGPSSLIISAADGSKAAVAVNTNITNERF